MRTDALFINGIFVNVLDDILKTPSDTPDRVLFLQPYSHRAIVMLRNNPPTIEDPVKLYLSTSGELAIVSYTAEIVGWEDKTQLTPERRDEVQGIIKSFQPSEGDLSSGEKPSLNLLSIRRLVRLASPFSVANLIKVSDGKPFSTNRSRSGGWSRVRSIEAVSSNQVAALIDAQETAMTDSGIFNPDSLEDARVRIAASIVQRRGQPEFRRKLLDAYGGCCAVTSCDVVDALEACHIMPYQGTDTNHPTNGLLLRADLHTLFDLGLIAFEPETGKVLLAAKLRGTAYDPLAEMILNMPNDATLRPSQAALKSHRTQSGL